MLTDNFLAVGGTSAWSLLGFSLLSVVLIIEQITFWTRPFSSLEIVPGGATKSRD